MYQDGQVDVYTASVVATIEKYIFYIFEKKISIKSYKHDECHKKNKKNDETTFHSSFSPPFFPTSHPPTVCFLFVNPLHSTHSSISTPPHTSSPHHHAHHYVSKMEKFIREKH